MMSSNIPHQVQAAAEEAARLEQTLQGDPQEAPVVEAPPPAPPPSPPKVVESTQPPEDWRQRYLTLQGMFNAEVPRLNARLKDLEGQLQARVPEPPTPPVAAFAPERVTPKDVEVFGGDLIDLIKRQSTDIVDKERAAVSAELLKVQRENAEFKKQLGGVVEKQGLSQRQVYLSDLTRAVPDAESLNVDARFLNWLAEIDPLSGVARQAYLNNAWEAFDAPRTANLFNAFKQAQGLIPQPNPLPDVQEELRRQVQPVTSGAAETVPDTHSERIWSKAQIERFYTDVTKGVYATKGAEAKRLEAEIDLAVASGRVR